MKKVLIIGLGLIGGSYALALTKSGQFCVDGVDTDEQTRNEALALSAVCNVYANVEDAVDTYDIVLIALNPDKIITLIEQHGAYFSKKENVVCDIAGLQGVIIESLMPLLVQWGIPYVSLHPMAGREKAGFAMAQATLFQNKSCLYTNVTASRMQLEAVLAMNRKIGFQTIKEVNPVEHDELIAYTSQLPHVVSVAFMNAWEKRQIEGYTGGSFEDMTRVSDINGELWSGLFLENKEALLLEISQFKKQLEAFEHALQTNDKNQLLLMMDNSSQSKQRVKNQLLKEGF